MRGIYIHIPFCKSKCPYCSFASYVGKEHLESEYVKRVIKEIISYEKEKIDTVYFGGGTPTCLSLQSLYEILNAIASRFEVLKDSEITLETNPKTTNEYVKLREMGFNRISFGVQSFNDAELKVLGRIHSAEQASNAIIKAKEAGFNNISADLMLATPFQTAESLEKSVRKMASLPVNHISVYSLSVEEGTPFFAQELVVPDEDTEREMYWQTVDLLCLLGFEHYEISNFAKDKMYSKHNTKYWLGQEYIGIGAAAHSYYKGVRYANTPIVEDYIKNENTVIEKTIIDQTERAKEYYMLGLRLISGAKEIPHKNMDKMIADGLVERKDGKVKLTRRGLDVSNYVFMNLM